MKINPSSKMAFHQICLNDTHQQNIVETDGLSHLNQGTPMLTYLLKIFNEANINLQQDIQPLKDKQEKIKLVKRNFVLEAIKHLEINHILEIRHDNSFQDNVTHLLNTKDHYKIEEILDSHIDFLTDKIKQFGIVPHENYLKEKRFFAKTSKLSKIQDFIENSTEVLQNTILGNIASYGTWSHMPVISESVGFALKSYFVTADMLEHLHQKQMWNNWKSAITFSLRPQLQ